MSQATAMTEGQGNPSHDHHHPRQFRHRQWRRHRERRRANGHLLWRFSRIHHGEQRRAGVHQQRRLCLLFDGALWRQRGRFRRRIRIRDADQRRVPDGCRIGRIRHGRWWRLPVCRQGWNCPGHVCPWRLPGRWRRRPVDQHVRRFGWLRIRRQRRLGHRHIRVQRRPVDHQRRRHRHRHQRVRRGAGVSLRHGHQYVRKQ